VTTRLDQHASTATAGAPARARAFTALELLFVLLIIVIAGGLVAPVVGSMLRSSALQAGASQVASALQKARNLAIRSGKVHVMRVVASEAPGTKGAQSAIYRLGEITELTRPMTQVEWDQFEAADKDVSGSVLPVEVEVAFSGINDYIIFMPDGSAWCDGMMQPVPLEVGLLEKYWRAGREYQVVSITSLTGRVTVGPVVK
jgi:Tfp pilus assembly protein FimT